MYRKNKVFMKTFLVVTLSFHPQASTLDFLIYMTKEKRKLSCKSKNEEQNSKISSAC